MISVFIGSNMCRSLVQSSKSLKRIFKGDEMLQGIVSGGNRKMMLT